LERLRASDGSSNIDVNISVGTISSVLRCPEGVTTAGGAAMARAVAAPATGSDGAIDECGAGRPAVMPLTANGHLQR